MIVQYNNELYDLFFYAAGRRKIKLILWSIYKGLEAMGEIDEKDKDYFLITTGKDMQECFDFLKKKYNFILESDGEIEISLK